MPEPSGQPQMVYRTEEERAAAFRATLNRYEIKLQTATVKGSDFRTNGYLLEEVFFLLITAGKNELSGTTKADPLLQAVASYVTALKQLSKKRPMNNLFPCFIIYYIGPNVGFAGAIFTEQFQIEILTPIFPFNFNSHETDMLLQATRAFSACKLAISELKTYYTQLAVGQSAANSLGNYTSSYPYKQTTSAPTVTSSNLNTSDQRLLFLAKTEDSDTIFVKFTRRYSADAHKHCAHQGVAPELYAFEPLSGGWYMVVMEHLDNQQFDDIPEWPQDFALLPKMEWTLRQLHEGGFVHGDVRTVNMKVRKQPKNEMEGVFLLDFDWAGVAGKARYPPNVNKQVWRSPSVEDGALITKEHDEDMVKHMFGRWYGHGL